MKRVVKKMNEGRALPRNKKTAAGGARRNSSVARRRSSHFMKPVRFFHEGIITFWKFRCTLDILIQKHDLFQNCLEVIGYEPVKDLESNHIFLDYQLIHSKWESSQSESGISQYIIHYIMARINIRTFDEQTVEICFNSMCTDTLNPETNLLDTIIDKPEELIPSRVNRKKVIP
jgi:hypothetical protein